MSDSLMRRTRRTISAAYRRYAGPLAYARRSYSQEGEDLLLERLFSNGAPGVYVDVGAHHPFRFSNTYLFYRRGWRGVNIDANPGSMKPFRRWRSRDVNLEIGISEEPGTLPYHAFEEPAFNTFDADLAAQRRDAGHPYLGGRVVECRSLSDVIQRHPFLHGVANSFLTVDVEGLDLAVLRSSDWARFRPSFVLAELLDVAMSQVDSTETSRFLSSIDYEPVAKLGNSCLFGDCRG